MIKLIISLAVFFLSVGCAELQKLSVTPPGGLVSEIPPKTSPPVEPAPSLDSAAAQAKVIALSVGSACQKEAHGNQGTPPTGFMKGIALTYARAICHQDQDWVKIASQPAGDPAKDAMAHYGLAPGPARLESTFALMVGSAARESSWRWCVGKDPGATNTSGETCEAGLYQTSWNSRSASAVLPSLFKEFKASPAGCFSKEYKGSTTCSADNMKNWGEGDGVEFQRLSKDCPGFASEYHAVMVRVRRTHYGPINLKKAEIKPSCVSMFSAIRKAIEADQSLCGAFQ